MNRHLVAALLCGAPLAAQAEGWEYSLAPYLWLPTISMDSTRINDGGGALDGLPLDIGPSDYLKALNVGLMLTGDMRKDDWVLMGDFIYLDFGIANEDIDILGPLPTTSTAEADLQGSVISLGAGRTFVRTARYYADALVGWRRFALDFDLAVDLLNNGTERQLGVDSVYNDAFVGISGRYQFSNDKWSLRYYADLGTGESDMTWQALVGVGYAFGWGELFANYRHLDYDLGDTDRLQDLTTTFSGPSIGARFRF